MTRSDFGPDWYLIIIDDPRMLSGESIKDMLQLLLSVIEFKYAVLDYIDGSGKNGVVFSLQEKKDYILEIEKVLAYLFDIKQLDWGDFFLFKEYPKNWNNPKGEFYPYVISQTNTTVRAVDNQYFYVYTPCEEIVEIIKQNYEIESITFDSLENLAYPE